MIKVGIRNFLHNYKQYLAAIQNKGERVVLMERNVPIVDLTPHNENASSPGWKREIRRIKLKSEISMSDMLVKDRRNERA